MPDLKRILAIETSHATCAVALTDNQILDSMCVSKPQSHSHELLPMIRTLLERHKLKLADLDAIALNTGPGSFTGLRVGAAVAQGLAFASGLKIIPVSGLYLMALAAAEKYQNVNQIISCIDARVNGVYWARFALEKTPESDVITRIKRLSEDRVSAKPFADIMALAQTTQCWVGDGLKVLKEAASYSANQADEANTWLADVSATKVQYDESLRPGIEDLAHVAMSAKTSELLEPTNLNLKYLGGTGSWKKIAEQH